MKNMITLVVVLVATTLSVFGQSTSVTVQTNFNDPTGLFGVDGTTFITNSDTGDFIESSSLTCGGNVYVAYSVANTDFLQTSLDVACRIPFGEKQELTARDGSVEEFDRFAIVPTPGILYAGNVRGLTFMRMPTHFVYSFSKGYTLHSFSVSAFPFRSAQRASDERQDGMVGITGYSGTMFLGDWTPNFTFSAVGGHFADRGADIDVFGVVMRLGFKHEPTSLFVGFLANKVLHNSSTDALPPIKTVFSVAYTL